MRAIWQDLRFGFRLFVGNPAFTALTVLTLGLGIGANTTVFSWVDGLLLHPFPGAAEGGQLAVLEMITDGAPNGGRQLSYLDYRDYRRNLRSLDGLALHDEQVFTLGDAGSVQAVWGELVSGNYFNVLGVKPALGRVFVREEDGDRPGAYPVAVISYNLWRRWFHSDPRAIGKTLRVNQRQLTVVGVAPPEFRGTMPGIVFEIWIPATMARALGTFGPQAFESRNARMFYSVARLNPGVDYATARAEAASFARSLAAAYPKTNRGVGATVLPVWEFHSAAPDLLLRPLRILTAIAALLLLIVCANVANLLLARSVARRKELGIRLALGARPSRLARQLLTEALLVAAGSAVVGLILASWLAGSLGALVPRIGVPVAVGFTVNGRVLAFTVLACVLAALASAAMPSLMCLRPDMYETLKAASPAGHSRRARSVLVVSEVALAAVALIGGALLLRSFREAGRMDPGFDRNNVTLARFYINGTGMTNPDLQQFCIRLRDHVRQAPAVSAVTYADNAPLGTGSGPYRELAVEGYTPGRGESMNVNRERVAPGYFATLRIPLLEGRDFTESDEAGAPPVIIVNQAFARRYFRGANPVGRKVRVGSTPATIVGMARDSKHFNIAETPQPHFYMPLRQETGGVNQIFFFIRTAPGGEAPAISELRRSVPAADARAGAFDVLPLTDWTEVTLLPQKAAASLAGALGLISLALAAVGLYSVMGYAVTQRTREIGIRMAVGAQPRDVLADVLLRGMALTAVGLAAGTAAALVLTRLLRGLLIGVTEVDPRAFAGAAAFLLLVALVASYLPARRATRIDPMAALRVEQ